MFESGTSFFVDLDAHLWIIISDLQLDPITAVWVNLTSFDPAKSHKDAHHDPACVLSPLDHGYIQHATCVSYAGAQMGRISGLKKRHGEGKLRFHDEPASAAMLEKMRAGASTSRYLPLDCWVLLDGQGLLPE